MASMVPIEHFCCQNSDCPCVGVRGGENLYFRGWSGKGRRIRLVYCRTCKRSFSERKGTVLEHARLPDDKALAILKHPVSYTHLRAHETRHDLVCRLLLEK